MAENFFSRWSQRKQAVRRDPTQVEPVAEHGTAPLPVVAEAVAQERVDSELKSVPVSPPLSVEDVSTLTSESSFKPFVARDVAPEVRNAAMRKLFTDPRFNVMDGMDIYVDDYSKADPLPESMLRQMVSAKFLKLFEDQEENKSASTDTPIVSKPPEQGTDHDNTDLRLQPNDATGRPQPGRSTE